MVGPDGEVTYNGTLSKILSTTGFKSKVQIIPKQCSPEEAGALGDKALGVTAKFNYQQ